MPERVAARLTIQLSASPCLTVIRFSLPPLYSIRPALVPTQSVPSAETASARTPASAGIDLSERKSKFDPFQMASLGVSVPTQTLPSAVSATARTSLLGRPSFV